MMGKIAGREYKSYNVDPRSSLNTAMLIIDDSTQRPKQMKEIKYRLFNTFVYISNFNDNIESKTVEIIPKTIKVKMPILIIIVFIENQ